MNTDIKSTCLGCGLLIAIYAVGVAVGAFCWNYALDAALALAGKESDFPTWGAVLIALIPGVNYIGLLFAAIMFVLKFFI